MLPGLTRLFVCHTVSAVKTITARTLKRETPEDRLSPGESLQIRKQGGRVFELKRVDAPRRSRQAGWAEAVEEVPNRGGKRTDVATWCAKDGL